MSVARIRWMRQLNVVCGLVAVASLIMVLDAVCWSVAAADRQPLLLEGKKTLFQRVITRPAAQLHSPTPDTAGNSVLPFSVFYVYGREKLAGIDWLEVGRSSQPPTAGWIRADQVVEWKQTLTVAFTNPAGRQKVLFFRDRAGLDALLNAPDVTAVAMKLRASEVDGKVPSGSPLIAIEPDNHIDINEHFYLLPILSFDNVQDSRGIAMRALEVASVPLEASPAQKPESTALRNFSAGLVFVIDTTLSMDPYIARTRETIRRIFDKIHGTIVGDRFRFGMVGFRSSVTATPKLEYTAKMFHKLDLKEDPGAIIPAVADVRASKVSSARFDEDSMAGVKAAIEGNDWSRFGGRYIVLITDAGGLAGKDPLSSTHLDPAEIWQLAQTKQVALFVIHLLTPEGVKDHALAARQYRELARWPNADALYFPVAGGGVKAFGETVDQLTDALFRQVAQTIGQPVTATPVAAPTNPKLAEQARIIGNAMRLAYLGRSESTKAPDMFKAWTVNRDTNEPAITSLDVRVLLTKNQLSDLSDALKLILDRGLSSELSPQDFFNRLRAAAAAMSRDPRQLGHVTKLRDLIGEYLDGLPYRSQILEIGEDDWLAMGAAAQREVLDTIESKLHLYQVLDANPNLWVSFDGGRVPGDAVYPVPLDALP